jgi:predicted ATPase/DNA-binding winged helix-turn-helix (wHTH) protein
VDAEIRFAFGRYILCPIRRQLERDGVTVPLGSRAIELLLALTERPGTLISKAELIKRGWSSTHVEENNLHVHISTIRKAFGEDAGYVVTEPGRGYRFAAAVEKWQAKRAEQPVTAEKHGSAHKTNLPGSAVRLIGRDRDLDAVRIAVESGPVVTIFGAGGIGKSRLAVAVGAALIEQFPDGVWWIELAGLRDTGQIPGQVATALGQPALADTNSAEALAAALAERSMLLILDNCEHLLEGVAALVGVLTTAAPQLRVLTTSREALRCPAEQVYRLPGLSLPDESAATLDEIMQASSVELFVERAHAADIGATLRDEDAGGIARICRRLDGIALALELAASVVPLLGLGTLEARLNDRFRLLTGGRRTALPRHQTLRATFDWGHDLLSEPERILLRRLSVFAGSFTLEAAEAVAQDDHLPEWQVMEALAGLIAKSLIVLEQTARADHYRLLETTQAYGFEKLEAAGEVQTLRLRHAAYMARYWAGFGETRLYQPEDVWRESAVFMLSDVRAALSFSLSPEGDADQAIALAGSTRPLWITLGLRIEGLRWATTTIERLHDRVAPLVAARLWQSAGLFHDLDLDAAIAASRNAAALYRQADDPIGIANALAAIGECLAMLGRLTEAEPTLLEALALLANRPVRSTELVINFNLGWVRVQLGDNNSAEPYFQRALALAQLGGETRTELVLYGNLSDIAYLRGDYAEADRINQIVFSRVSETAYPDLMVMPLISQISIEVGMGALDEALATARQAMPLLRKYQSVLHVFDALALRHALAGRLDDAAILLGFTDHAANQQLFSRRLATLKAVNELRPLLETALPYADRHALAVKGALMTEDQAITLALAE